MFAIREIQDLDFKSCFGVLCATNRFDQEIDGLGYGLTEEEIRIVGGA
jgi:hypothetical protein